MPSRSSGSVAGWLEAAASGVRLLSGLPRFLRLATTTERAAAELRARRAARRDAVASAIRRASEAHATPYPLLLRAAGLVPEDAERLVQQSGIEHALTELLDRGVCLSVQELTGRAAVVRRGHVVQDAARLSSSRKRAGPWTSSSGSRVGARVVPVDFAFLAERAIDDRLLLEARGGLHWEHAVWEAPGGGLLTILRYARCGATPHRWFSPVDPRTPGLGPRYRWSAAFVRLSNLMAGARLPRLEVVPIASPGPVLDWMRAVLRRGGTPHLDTFVTPALRLAHAARAAGADLSGARFTVVGEPITQARRRTLESTGAEVLPTYRTAEAGAIGIGCLAPAVADEVHVLDDLVAVIPNSLSGRLDQARARTLFVTSLRPRAPMMLLNAALGDEAVIGHRACGCPLEALGWTTHLHSIRGVDKLTAAGMTFLDVDLVRVLDELLPARFGGGPTHYQLVEDESDDGQPILRLLVDPALGRVDAEAVRDAFLDAIGAGPGSARIMALHWRASGLPRVQRHVPVIGRTGKILHLHQGRRLQP